MLSGSAAVPTWQVWRHGCRASCHRCLIDTPAMGSMQCGNGSKVALEHVRCTPRAPIQVMLDRRQAPAQRGNSAPRPMDRLGRPSKVNAKARQCPGNTMAGASSAPEPSRDVLETRTSHNDAAVIAGTNRSIDRFDRLDRNGRITPRLD